MERFSQMELYKFITAFARMHDLVLCPGYAQYRLTEEIPIHTLERPTTKTLMLG